MLEGCVGLVWLYWSGVVVNGVVVLVLVGLYRVVVLVWLYLCSIQPDQLAWVYPCCLVRSKFQTARQSGGYDRFLTQEFARL